MSRRRRKRRRVKSAAGYLRIAERNRRVNEAKHDQTRQRRFERNFLSRDLPDSKAARADASDGGRLTARLVEGIDAPTRRERQIAAINAAAAKLPRRSGWLRKLLWAIFRNGRNRELTMRELHLPKWQYWRGVKYFLDLYADK